MLLFSKIILWKEEGVCFIRRVSLLLPLQLLIGKFVLLWLSFSSICKKSKESCIQTRINVPKTDTSIYITHQWNEILYNVPDILIHPYVKCYCLNIFLYFQSLRSLAHCLELRLSTSKWIQTPETESSVDSVWPYRMAIALIIWNKERVWKKKSNIINDAMCQKYNSRFHISSKLFIFNE